MRLMMRERSARSLLVGLLILAIPETARACSVPLCLGRGMELRPDFKVTIRHDGKPLRQVRVTVTASNAGSVGAAFSGDTSLDGSFSIQGLPPGDYWIRAERLGIQAADHCFHVAASSRRSWKAKKHLQYEWGEFPFPIVRQTLGTLMDRQPGRGESPWLNSIHRVDVPIRGAHLKLQSPITDQSFVTTSDADGRFAFQGVPAGTYVLHIEGGQTGRPYDVTDFVIRIEPERPPGSGGGMVVDSLDLIRGEDGGGSCGSNLQLDNRRRGQQRRP